jgi:hypothetical protein
MFWVKVIEECTQDCGFPRSHLSCKGYESYTIIDAIEKVCKGLFMVPAQEDKAGVWSQVKRLFPKTMKIEVHLTIPFDAFTSLKKEEEGNTENIKI